MKNKSLESLSLQPVGTKVCLSFENGVSFTWFYAGVLVNKIGERVGQPPELLFTDTCEQIECCRKTRSFHKLTHSGYSSACPGQKFKDYTLF